MNAREAMRAREAIHEPTGLEARDARSLWHPYTQHALERDPLCVKSAHGSLLVLEDGREIIDAISSWWSCLHGHGHPKLIEAAERQARTLDHVLFAGCTHRPAIELAERLLASAPPGLSRVFYSDDGSTAVEVALKMVLQSWAQAGEVQRTIFVALEGGYHGDTFGAMSVGDPEPFFRAFEPLLFRAERVPVEAGSVATRLDALGQRAAGVILEPLVQGAGGMRMHSPSFVRDVRSACDHYGVPMIADEVMTGFGRTGELFACTLAGVSPDLLCLAKCLTSGAFPLAATLSTERFYESFLSADRGKAFFHGHTYTAHPVGCAVALASLELCVNERVPARLDAIGKLIETELQAILEPHGKISGTRRTGGIVALELALTAGMPAYLDARALALRRAALDLGVLLRPLGNVIYAMPPASTTPEQCSRIAAAMAALARL